MTRPVPQPAPPADGETKETYHVEVWRQRTAENWTLYATCNGLSEAQQEVRWYVQDAVHPGEMLKRFKIYEVKTTTTHEELRF